jgi:hypothetical protein
VVVVVCGQYRLPPVFATASARRLRSFSVIWTCFVTIKCPNDQQLTATTEDLDAAGGVASRRSGVARPCGSPGAALDGTGQNINRR